MTGQRNVRKLNPCMDPSKRGNEDAGTHGLHSVIVKAYSAKSRQEFERAEMYLSEIQSLCLRHINFVGALQLNDIASDKSEHRGEPMEYYDLIMFLSGLGVSCADVVSHIENSQQFRLVSN